MTWCCHSSSWLRLNMRAQTSGRLLQDLQLQRQQHELPLRPRCRRCIAISSLNEAVASLLADPPPFRLESGRESNGVAEKNPDALGRPSMSTAWTAARIECRRTEPRARPLQVGPHSHCSSPGAAGMAGIGRRRRGMGREGREEVRPMSCITGWCRSWQELISDGGGGKVVGQLGTFTRRLRLARGCRVYICSHM